MEWISNNPGWFYLIGLTVTFILINLVFAVIFAACDHGDDYPDYGNLFGMYAFCGTIGSLVWPVAILIVLFFVIPYLILTQCWDKIPNFFK